VDAARPLIDGAHAAIDLVNEMPARSRSGGSPDASLCFLRLPVNGRLGRGQDNECLAGHCADVVMQAHQLDAGDFLDHRLHERQRRFNQLASELTGLVADAYRFWGCKSNVRLLNGNPATFQ
jgi:hypothetical protein